jgi:hypothetical protein
LLVLLLAACDVQVTSPDDPALHVAAPDLVGRWQARDAQAQPRDGNYLVVRSASPELRYAVEIYEEGKLDSRITLTLAAAAEPGRFWGFARGVEESPEDLLFHLELTGDQVVFRWSEETRIREALDQAGLAYQQDASDTGLFKWTTLKIRAPRAALLQTLRAAGDRVLEREQLSFQRLPAGTGP